MSPDYGERVKPEIMPSGWFTGIGNKATERINNATRFIEEQTGFSAEEIDSECRRLENKYRGAKQAPFSVVLGP